MKLATVPFAAALLLFVHFGKSGSFPKPQARPAPITGVILQSYEAVNETWIAHLVNLSHKEVVAVSISPEPYEEVTKFYGCYFSHGAPVDDCDRASYPGWHEYFLPGETKDLELRSVREEQINPVVDVIIYADDTAEVSNDRTFQRILRDWKESLLTIQKENEILLKHASSPHRAADAARELDEFARTVPLGSVATGVGAPPSVNPIQLRIWARQLRDGQIDYEQTIRENEKWIAKNQPHTEIRKITGGES